MDAQWFVFAILIASLRVMVYTMQVDTAVVVWSLRFVVRVTGCVAVYIMIHTSPHLHNPLITCSSSGDYIGLYLKMVLVA